MGFTQTPTYRLQKDTRYAVCNVKGTIQTGWSVTDIVASDSSARQVIVCKTASDEPDTTCSNATARQVYWLSAKNDGMTRTYQQIITKTSGVSSI